MRVLALVFAALCLAAAFSGCSSKQINETASDITQDITDFGKKATEQH